MHFAIIGAGIAGLSAGRALVEAGHQVSLFDKGRGPGGRLSTRRVEVAGKTLHFDHGAQYFSPQSEAFGDFLRALKSAVVVADWQGRMVRIDAQREVTVLDAKPRYVGVPGMNEVIRAMAGDLDVTWGARVLSLSRPEGAWMLSFEDGTVRRGFDQIIVAVPAEQIAPMVEHVSAELSALSRTAVSSPCWTVMAAFDQPIGAPWDAAKIEDSPLAWIARNSSKPCRDFTETWVLQASAEWSQAHLEHTPEDVAGRLLGTFSAHTGAGAPAYHAAHRWRYSQIRTPAQQAYFHDGALGLSACGDWCLGPNAEHAWESGQSLAAALVGVD